MEHSGFNWENVNSFSSNIRSKFREFYQVKDAGKPGYLDCINHLIDLFQSYRCLVTGLAFSRNV